MLKDVPHKVLKDLYESEDSGFNSTSVYYHGINGYTYKINYRPRRSFTITRLKKPLEYKQDKYGKFKPIPDNSVTLWDVSGFFKERFVDALGDKEVGYFYDHLYIEGGHEIIKWDDGTSIDLTKMKEMKNRRRSFTREQIEEEILPYCKDEVKALQRLMERLREILEKAELLPFQSQWYGAGACANTILQRYHVKESMQETWPYGRVRALRDAQLTSYSGGRFEIGKFGLYIGKVWNYDLRSAFPSIMVDLPCLTNGTWSHVQSISFSPYSIVHIRWQLAGSTFYPFFFRNDQGSIYFPDGNEKDGGLEGWYWKPEVDAALKALAEGKLKGKIEVLESWEFQPYYDTKPFAFMHDIYETRRQWQAEGNPAHKVMKFVINYIYGKTIQSLGWKFDRFGNIDSPGHHNVGYAGYTTSSIRAKIFEAMMQAPDQIINVVSDGLYSLVPLDLPKGDGMGQWKVSESDGIVMINPGVFWVLTKLDREPTEQERQEEFFNSKYFHHDGVWYETDTHYQGYDRDKLKPIDVVNKWRIGEGGTIKVRSTRLVTLASALLDDELYKCLGSWREIEMELWPYPKGKRRSEKLPLIEESPAEGLEGTIADDVFFMKGTMSAKFKRAWEDNDDDSEFLIDGVDREVYNAEHMDSEL